MTCVFEVAVEKGSMITHLSQNTNIQKGIKNLLCWLDELQVYPLENYLVGQVKEHCRIQEVSYKNDFVEGGG